MALHTGIRQSRVICSFSKTLKPYSALLIHNQAFDKEKFNYENNNGKANESSFNWTETCKLVAAIGLTGFALKHGHPKNELLAEQHRHDSIEEDAEHDLIEQENR